MEPLARMLVSIAGLVAIAVALGAPASASAESTAQRADRIMREVTSRMTHAPSATGIDEDSLSLAELVARYDRGERLYIRCGNQAMVAQAILRRNGIRSRLVGTLSGSGPLDPTDLGHTFMEVWTGHRWIAYDPDANRQWVDAQGHPIGAVRATYERPWHFRYIASDPFLEGRVYPYSRVTRDIDDVMGIVAIDVGKGPGQYMFSYRKTPKAVARVNRSGLGWTAVGEKRWAKITRGEA
jgi:transglutaminase-like putative cysteine protease